MASTKLRTPHQTRRDITDYVRHYHTILDEIENFNFKEEFCESHIKLLRSIFQENIEWTMFIVEIYPLVAALTRTIGEPDGDFKEQLKLIKKEMRYRRRVTVPKD